MKFAANDIDTTSQTHPVTVLLPAHVLHDGNASLVVVVVVVVVVLCDISLSSEAQVTMPETRPSTGGIVYDININISQTL